VFSCVERCSSFDSEKNRFHLSKLIYTTIDTSLYIGSYLTPAPEMRSVELIARIISLVLSRGLWKDDLIREAASTNALNIVRLAVILGFPALSPIATTAAVVDFLIKGGLIFSFIFKDRR
jgi:hypothetical protein